MFLISKKCQIPKMQIEIEHLSRKDLKSTLSVHTVQCNYQRHMTLPINPMKNGQHFVFLNFLFLYDKTILYKTPKSFLICSV